MGDIVANKHDATFKEVFSQKRIAKDFLEQNIPKEALDVIDIDSIELTKDTFADKELKEHYSDLVYKAKIQGGDGYICFLLEHKSYRDPLTAFQLSRYILEAWTYTVRKGNKMELPIILPLVIYHGKGEWKLEEDLRDMIPGFNELPQYFKERMPVFRYDLLNIGKSGDDDFKRYTRLTAMMLTAFRYAFEEDVKIVIREFLLAVEDAHKEENVEVLTYYTEVYLNYIGQTHKDATKEDIIEGIKSLGGKGAVTMGILEKEHKEGIQLGRQEGMRKGRQEGMRKGRQEGMRKGRQEGMRKGRQEEKIKIAKNLLREEAEVALIVKATGLSKSYVESLKEEITE